MPFGLIEKLTPSDENLVDYILWTGAYDFREYPFRDADALVLCMLSYFDMKMLFTDGRTEIKLKELLPDARIGIAHGKIDEDELSEIWRQLVDREN